MQFTDNVQWTYGDFIIMGCMLTVYMLTINFAPNSLNGVKKSLLMLVLGLLFLLLWAELAVGIFNSPFAGS